MTTAQASECFHIDTKEIRTLCKEKLIPDAYRFKGKYVIPDDTKVILSKNQIRMILLHLLKYLNSDKHLLPELLNDEIKRSCVLECLYHLGFITYESLSLEKVRITDEGFSFLFEGKHNSWKFDTSLSLISFSPKIGLINAF